MSNAELYSIPPLPNPPKTQPLLFPSRISIVRHHGYQLNFIISILQSLPSRWAQPISRKAQLPLTAPGELDDAVRDALSRSENRTKGRHRCTQRQSSDGQHGGIKFCVFLLFGPREHTVVSCGHLLCNKILLGDIIKWALGGCLCIGSRAIS